LVLVNLFSPLNRHCGCNTTVEDGFYPIPNTVKLTELAAGVAAYLIFAVEDNFLLTRLENWVPTESDFLFKKKLNI